MMTTDCLKMILHWLVFLTVLSFPLAVPADDQEDAAIAKLKESFLKLMKAMTAESTGPGEKREKRGVEVPGDHDEHLSNLFLELVSLLRTTPGPPGLPGIPGPAYCLNDTYDTPCNETGSPGVPGPPGASGPKGETGEVGPAGTNGTNGDEGPVGPTGLPGLKGEKGIGGSVGAKGARGTQGSVGTKGDKGEQEISGLHLRLVNGSGPHEGRVEVRSNPYGEWGTVCDDGWYFAEANVVCRSLGYHLGALAVPRDVYFGEGSGSVVLDDFKCTGSESNLAQCSHGGWGSHDCSHPEGASVICRRSLCPSPYQEILSYLTKKCVFVSTSTATWSSAKQNCENDGAYLVTFSRRYETLIFGIHLFDNVDSSEYWWIGGQKIGSTWYWRGILTGRIPQVGTAESGWHKGHSEDNEPPCMYFKTADGSNFANGWDSHSSAPCSDRMKYICEKPI